MEGAYSAPHSDFAVAEITAEEGVVLVLMPMSRALSHTLDSAWPGYPMAGEVREPQGTKVGEGGRALGRGVAPSQYLMSLGVGEERKKPWRQMGWVQSCPAQPGAQEHVLGATQAPPLPHTRPGHRGVRQSNPPQARGQVHVCGALQFPPLPHVKGHTGVVQLASNQPGAQLHVSGAVQSPWGPQDWAHWGVEHTLALPAVAALPPAPPVLV